MFLSASLQCNPIVLTRMSATCPANYFLTNHRARTHHPSMKHSIVCYYFWTPQIRRSNVDCCVHLQGILTPGCQCHYRVPTSSCRSERTRNLDLWYPCLRGSGHSCLNFFSTCSLLEFREFSDEGDSSSRR